MLSLLTEIARAQPILVLVDDAHWLDQESIDALALVARRLDHEAIGLILCRRSEQPVSAVDGLPDLRLGSLEHPDALILLGRAVNQPLQQRISSQIVTTTAGNPLALIDLAHELSTLQLVSLTLLPEPLPIGSHLEAHYLRQTQALGQDLQTWLLLAAAEPMGDPAYVAGVAAVLGIDVNAADLAAPLDVPGAEESSQPSSSGGIHPGAMDLRVHQYLYRRTVQGFLRGLSHPGNGNIFWGTVLANMTPGHQGRLPQRQTHLGQRGSPHAAEYPKVECQASQVEHDHRKQRILRAAPAAPQEGWEQVADYALDWALTHGTRAAEGKHRLQPICGEEPANV